MKQRFLILILCFMIRILQAGPVIQDTLPRFWEDKWNYSLSMGTSYASEGPFWVERNLGSLVTMELYRNLGQKNQLGLGAGLHIPYTAGLIPTVPLYISYQNWLSPSSIFSIGVKAGYAVAFRNRSFDIFESAGGIFLHPNLGIKINPSNDWVWSFHLGVLHQRFQYHQEVWNNGESVTDIKLWRYVFTMNILL